MNAPLFLSFSVFIYFGEIGNFDMTIFYEWMNEWMNVRTNEWTNERTNEWNVDNYKYITLIDSPYSTFQSGNRISFTSCYAHFITKFIFTLKLLKIYYALVARTHHPPFSNFLFTNLFSITFLYFFIISSLFPYFNLFVSIFIQYVNIK
jgi:hypothetical protein